MTPASTSSVPVSTEEIGIIGAREHNLSGFSVTLPHRQLIGICGVSGSGKSSLAFDTIYAEAQRRYLESVSPFTRHLLGAVSAPQVDRITGLPAAIAVKQLVTTPPENSNVGTLSQVSDLLRVLFSRFGDYPTGQGRLLASAFSPNTVEGACPTCAAKGSIHEINLDAAVPDETLTIREGAIAAWPGGWLGRNFRHLVEAMGIDVDIPWNQLPSDTRTWLLTTEDTPSLTVNPADIRDHVAREYTGKFRSARRYLLDTMVTTGSTSVRERTEEFLSNDLCPDCHGSRINPAALSVTIGGATIAEVAERSLTELAVTINAAIAADLEVGPSESKRFSAATDDAAHVLLDELDKRTDVIERLGVGYLPPNRSAATLSPGELQRLRLAAHLHSGLHGMVYVFDELSTGLHPQDTDHLFTHIEALRDAGNTVILVEHDMEIVRRCDWVVELGPGGGARGGQLMFSGPIAEALAGESSTAVRLRNEAPTQPWRDPQDFTSWAQCTGLSANNLDGLTIAFPLGGLTTMTGVSGAGKSSVLRSVASLARSAGARSFDGDEEPQAMARGGERRELAGASATGLEIFDRIVSFDQSTIGRSPRSVIGTYLGIFDKIRALFAKTELARSRGFTASQFSFNTARGRCPRCEGLGIITIDLVHLPASSGTCPECEGRRFTEETLDVTVEDLSIADVLDLSIDAAATVFAERLGLSAHFEVLQRVGLGGLLLGQSSATLSGGEAQRLRLASVMRARKRRERSLFILDEPANGLHPSDARVLGQLFRQIVDEGDTILIADHNMELAAGSDWLIDLGPGPGPEGGRIVAEGPPRDVADAGVGATAAILAERFGSTAG
ncbi:ATP-binding cassette domain-containing protein [Brevibacterium sp. ZH18]|uniref:ATP-binding cassette domain-containing protein n=1 Tax=Brevibacterium sp. ZH18 TaxID=2927784 RepID=UPI001F6102F5|nr:ATP-binding cassette domain-containing protein [Brevibacterium sp. ZH18]MCI4011492.1 ATP-binding cassette domain-containing protein [Brevibacterium sp. ZH18]